MEGRFREGYHKGERAVILENDEFAATILPERGAKVASLFAKTYSRELLWQLPRASYSRAPDPTGPFGPEDSTGFDDLFPTISSCAYQEDPWKATPMGDHGELWPIPWHCQRDKDGGIVLAAEGREFPYRFEKRLSLRGSKLRVDYQVVNKSNHYFHCLWAAHPLFSSAPGMNLRLPPLSGSVINAFGSTELGPVGALLGYPGKGDGDLSAVGVNTGMCRKFYVSKSLSEGWCTLIDPVNGLQIRVSFPVDQVPYLGIWINEGGWGNQNNVGIEPATAAMDDPFTARRFGMAGGLTGGETKNWYLEIGVEPLQA